MPLFAQSYRKLSICNWKILLDHEGARHALAGNATLRTDGSDAIVLLYITYINQTFFQIPT